ncbi:MAG: helix-turn-helix domain-containing protein [Clostridia bacterium]|nr:helix-turn-helix domain-containing protein [Clostridia bacterium]
MDADIRIFISGIREKTGINFSVYDAGGDYIAGNGNIGDTVPTDFEGIKRYPTLNKTLFYIKYKSKCFIGSIDGCTETEYNYAFLIGELAENSYFKESGLSRTDFCKAILLGETNHSQISRYMRKYSMKDMPSFVMVMSVSPVSIEDVMQVLKTYGNEGLDFVVKIDDSQLAFVKFIDEDSNEYQSSTEYAEFLRQSVYEETGVSVRISIGGTVKTIADLSTSYSQAMTAVRMCNAINSKGEVHSFKEYMLIKMIEDLPKYKLNEYLETLLDSGAREIFLDDEMINTAEEFLENSLNVSETSRKLYLHRNTLTYRLDKIEKATGLNIRKFSDAVTFRLITILSKLVR